MSLRSDVLEVLSYTRYREPGTVDYAIDSCVMKICDPQR